MNSSINKGGLVRGVFYGFFLAFFIAAFAFQYNGWLGLAILIIIPAITGWLGSRVKKAGEEGVVSMEGLTSNERTLAWIFSFIASPIVTGAIMYFLWRKTHPVKAKQANRISIIVFIILFAVGILFQIFIRPRITDSLLSSRGFVPISTENADGKNSYKNDVYKFTIDFPRGWKQVSKEGLTVGAFNDEGFMIGIQEVKKLPPNMIGKEEQIPLLYKNNPEAIKSVIAKSFPDAQFEETDIVKIDGKDAFYVKVNTKTEQGRPSIVLSYLLGYKGNLYQFLVVSSQSRYPELETTIKNSINSFSFYE